MILLQAAMAAGFILLLTLGVFLLIGVPLLTGLFMRTYWKLSGKKQNIEKKTPYYKDILPFFLSILLSAVITLIFFYSLLILFDKLYPNFLEYS